MELGARSMSEASLDVHLQDNDSGAIDLSEALLLRRLQQDDGDAFDAIFRVHYATVCHVAARYKSPEASTEDIAQEIFSSLWIHRATLPVKKNLRAYLCVAAKRRALNTIRNSKTVHRLLDRSDRALLTESFPPEQEHALDMQELRKIIAAAVEGFPKRRLKAWRLRWDGHSIPEIARRMNISTRAVEYHITEAYQALYAVLQAKL